MAGAGGQPSPALIRVVIGQHARFDVFQLVRLLRHRPEGPLPVGLRMRFCADLSAAFPGHEVSRLGQSKPMADFRRKGLERERLPVRVELRTANYCVASELGPLPEPFLEWVREEERKGPKAAMPSFLDAFNQRVHVLRHELKNQSLRALDPAPPAQTDYAHKLAALMGMALPAQQAQMPLPMRAWLGLSALLVNPRKSGAVVAQILGSYLGVHCALRMLVGRWREIERPDRMSLGKAGHVLGRNSLLGQHTWDARAAVALDVAPMHYERVCALLPLRRNQARDRVPTAEHDKLVAMIRMLLDRRFDCDVTLRIAPDTVPPSRLNLPWRSGGLGLRLGQTAWLGAHRGASVRFVVAAFDAESASNREDAFREAPDDDVAARDLQGDGADPQGAPA